MLDEYQKQEFARINQTVEGTEDSQASIVNSQRQTPLDLKERVDKMVDTIAFNELKVLFKHGSQKLL